MFHGLAVCSVTLFVTVLLSILYQLNQLEQQVTLTNGANWNFRHRHNAMNTVFDRQAGNHMIYYGILYLIIMIKR